MSETEEILPNAQRKYSIAEIDAMRKHIASAVMFHGMGHSYDSAERAAEVEDQLRTHMLNGTSVTELEEYARAVSEEYFAVQRAKQERYREIQKQHADKNPERPRPEGVLECLRVEDKRANAFNHGGFRCDSCSATQPSDAFIVWVPDGVRMGERAASITNSVNANKFNGNHSGWCLDCARRLTRKAG